MFTTRLFWVLLRKHDNFPTPDLYEEPFCEFSIFSTNKVMYNKSLNTLQLRTPAVLQKMFPPCVETRVYDVSDEYKRRHNFVPLVLYKAAPLATK